MNGFTNSILSLLLSWIRLLIGQIWAALNSENGSRALSFLQSNWKFLVVCLAVGGFVADRLVYFLRWRPDTVWRNRRKARRSQRHGDDQDEKHGELQPQAHPLHGRISSFGSMRTLGCVMLESGRQTRSLVIRGASSDVSHCSTSPKRKARVEQAATQAG